MSGIGLGQAADGLPEKQVPTEAARWVIAEHQLDDAGLALLDGWLAESEDHTIAYADARAVWDDLGYILPDWKRDTLPAPRPEPEVVRSLATYKPQLVLGSIISVVLGMTAWLWAVSPQSFRTDVGEQRMVRLADGSRVTLNTGSTLVVERFGEERRVRLGRGEALFDVAHDQQHPFLVEAMGRTVRVVGTSFIVRRDAGRLDVTLLRGAVAVEQAGASTVRLVPGERLRQRTEVGRPTIDRPSLDVVTAWREGELVLDNTPLREAVQEMNRYSSRSIVFDDPALGNERLSGVFKTGDSASFAKTIAAIYGLKVVEEKNGSKLMRALPGVSRR